MEWLRLRPLNVLIGPNGSGKSTFIGAFEFLHEICEGRLKDYVTKAGGAEKVLHFGSKTTKAITLSLSFEKKVNEYELELTPTVDDGLFPSSEVVSYHDRNAYPGPLDRVLSAAQEGREAGISNPRNRVASWVRSRLRSWRIYHLHDTSSSSPMRKTAKVDDNRFFRPDGSNLAAFLYYLQEKHYESYSLIERSVQRVAPFFDDFQLRASRTSNRRTSNSNGGIRDRTSILMRRPFRTALFASSPLLLFSFSPKNICPR